MLEIQGKGAFIFPSYLTKNESIFSGYSCARHETGIMVIPWIGREVISNGKLYTNFWKVWHCIFACFIRHSQLWGSRFPLNLQNIGNRPGLMCWPTGNWKPTELQFQGVVSDIAFFCNIDGIPSSLQDLDSIFCTDRVEVAACDGRETENGQGVYVHLWVLTSNSDTWIKKTDPWRWN